MSQLSSSLGTALVTGASSGIGKAFAQRLASEGYDLLLVARRAERLEELAGELRALGGRAEVLVADLANAADLARVEERIRSEERLAMLVNNAGFAHFGAFLDEEPDAAEAGLRVMVLATVRLTRAALPAFKAARAGAVINISSRAAFGVNPRLATYSAAKAYVNRFTQSVADEVESEGVRFVAVCPGNVQTELFERAGIDPETMRGCLDPEQVVEEALCALRAGSRVCVPGERGRDRWIRKCLPLGFVKKVSGYLNRIAGS